MLSLVLSTVVFFVASYFLSHYLESVGIPKGMTRGVSVFCLAALLSYGVAALVDWIVP
jgi:hypothetical protein